MNPIGINGANMPNGIGGMAGMQAGANGVAQRTQDDPLDFKQRLNTYIYDYLLKNNEYNAAKALLNSNLSINTKQSKPKQRPNGIGVDAMDTDSKDNIDMKRPDDLPDPDKLLESPFENSFLLDWFTLFWEVFMAPRSNRHPKLNPTAIQYMNHTREQSRMNNEQRQNLLRGGPMAPANVAQYRNMMIARNGVNPTMQSLTPQQQQQVLHRQQLLRQQQNMERAGSEMDMNGAQRPRSPSGMIPTGMEMQNPDYYTNGQMRPAMSQAGVGGQPGNHALQDYQMQLMLLEQQNKKRLLMARQEQDQMRPEQQGNMAGQQAFAPGMSPQGSRSGPSPNPSEQMKRGTPKLNQSGLPESPMPDGSMAGRGSPANFNGNMPMDMMKNMGGGGHQFNPQMAQQQQQMDPAMRAPNNRMQNVANYQQGGPQAPNPMGPQVGQMSGPMGGAGTPQARNAAMPPPQNVPTANTNPNGQANQNNQNVNNTTSSSNNTTGSNAASAPPASPAPSGTAGTPQQAHKANPKKPKTDKDRKRTTKKNTAAAATPSAEGENPPPTPQTQTPATPQVHKSFPESKTGQVPSTNAQAAAPVQAPALLAQSQNNDTEMREFETDLGDLNSGDMSMDFAALDGEDVLNHFDFDQFISNDGQDFDLSAFGDYSSIENS